MNCGGAETLIMNIYRSVDREKIQFDFLVNVFDKMFYEDEITSLGGRIYRMPFLTKVSPPVYAQGLYKFFREHGEFKTVHSHLETTTGLILKEAKRAGVPSRIAHSHNSRYTRTGAAAIVENLYKDHCKKLIVPNATLLFGCSDLACKWLYGKSAEKAVIINNGIDTEKYRFLSGKRAEKRAELKLPDGVPVLGHVGRFNDQKNHLFLIDIFASFLKICPDAVLVSVGEGPLFETVKNKAISLGIEKNIIFTGLRSDVDGLMQAFDVFLLPSKFEGLPVVLAEAQCSGLPCVVSDKVSAMSDLKSSFMRFLPIENADVWADNIADILKSEDIDRAAACKKTADAGFDIKKTADMLSKTYLNAERGSD